MTEPHDPSGARPGRLRDGTSRWTDARSERIAVAVWILYIIGVGVLVGLRPEQNTVTPEYRGAAGAWLATEPLYTEGQHGYLYPPPSALLYVPFTLPPLAAGEVLWRVFGLGLLALAVWRLARVAAGPLPARLFLMMTLMTIPASTGSAHNGQMNIPLAAMMVLSVACMAERRWWWATACLTLALAFKPLAIVLILLAGALYPPTRWRIPLGLVALAVLPFLLHTSPGYVFEQYRAGVEKVIEAGSPGAGEFSDLAGPLRAIGVTLPDALWTYLRVGFALVTLGLSWLALRRRGHVRGTLLMFALGASYLMLFNPRTEGNSYVIVAPAVAVLASWAFVVERRIALGWLLAAMCFGLGFVHGIMPGGKDRVARPLMTLVFGVGVVAQVFTRRPMGGHLAGEPGGPVIGPDDPPGDAGAPAPGSVNTPGPGAVG